MAKTNKSFKRVAKAGKSLPTQIKEILHYHVSQSDIAADAEFRSLIVALNKLDRKVNTVKKQIIEQRKSNVLVVDSARWSKMKK
ncbi:MAG: hypothetical protein ABWW63_08515 [Glaciecola sp.]|jgi:hypothetical protein